MSDRWQYLTVEIKPGMLSGLKPEAVDEVLNRHGRLGWELVNVIYTSALTPALAFFKKAI
jgi:hypothetical protein